MNLNLYHFHFLFTEYLRKLCLRVKRLYLSVIKTTLRTTTIILHSIICSMNFVYQPRHFSVNYNNKKHENNRTKTEQKSIASGFERIPTISLRNWLTLFSHSLETWFHEIVSLAGIKYPNFRLTNPQNSIVASLI